MAICSLTLRPPLSQAVLSPCYSRLALKKSQMGPIFPAGGSQETAQSFECGPPCVGLIPQFLGYAGFAGELSLWLTRLAPLPQPPRLIGRIGLGAMPGLRATRP